MNKRISAKDLSAYIDGEARNAEAVHNAIEQSDTVAREYQALKDLSAKVQDLPEPELRPGFAQRVVAHVQDDAPVASFAFPWRLPVAASLAAAAVVLVVTLLTGLNPNIAEPARSTVAQPAPETDTMADEAALLAELERRVAADESVQAFVTARFDNAPQPAELYTEDLVLALFASEDIASAGQAFTAHAADYRPALRGLDEEQSIVLKELLVASVSEAQEG